MRYKSKALATLIPFSILTTLVPFSAFATTYTWTGGDTDANWSTDSNWNPSTGYPSTSADTALYSGSSAQNTNLDTPTIINSLQFSGSNTVGITGGATDTITFVNNSGTQPSILDSNTTSTCTISVPIVLQDSLLITVTNNVVLNINGEISDGGLGYGLGTSGSGTVEVSQTNTYFGPTTITSADFLAGSTSAFSPNSDFTVSGGTLSLLTYSNTVKSLSSTSGAVNLGTGGTVLTILNGGTFSSGVLTEVTSGGCGLTLSGGTFSLGVAATYTGTTTIGAGTFTLSGGSLDSVSSVVVDGTFNISDAASNLQTIASLSGTGSILLGSSTLTLTENGTSGTFSGTISGSGGSFSYIPTTASSSFTLETAGSTYSGTTTIGTDGTLVAAVENAFSPNSAVTFTGGSNGGLAINANNTIASVSGAGEVSINNSSTLTISNGSNGLSFTGRIVGSGAQVALTGGTLLLSPTSTNTYSGLTTVSNSAILQAGSTTALSTASGIVLQDSSELNLSTFSNTIPSLTGSSDTITNIGSGATLTITDGGTFDGAIQGAGALYLNGGTLILSNENDNFTGGTTVGSGTLTLTGSGQLYSSGPVVVDGAFNISGISASSTTIGVLSGSGNVNLGAKELIVTTSGTGALSGNIQGVGGSLGVIGTGTLTLSGNNTYTGDTSIALGALLNASSGAALASLSDFTVDGTLLLSSGSSNTINTLQGASTGVITASPSANTLVVSNGGTFAGTLEGGVSLTLLDGVLNLSGVNSQVEPTTISGGTLALVDAGRLPSTNSVTANGTLDISGMSPQATQTLVNLSGSGAVVLGDNSLTLNSSQANSFSGNISGTGNVTYSPSGAYTFTLGGSNSYTGTTTIGPNGTLQAASTTAFAPGSAFIVGTGSLTGTLNLAGFNNTILSLNSTDALGTVTSTGGVLTISNGGTFPGVLTGSLGLNLSGGILDLTGTSNNYSGVITLSNSAILNAGAAGALSSSSSSAVVLQEASQLNLLASNTVFSLSGDIGTIVTIGVGDTLTVSGGGVFNGEMTGSGALGVTGGTFSLSNDNNDFSGGTTIGASGTLALTGVGLISSSGTVAVAGVLDVSDIISSTTIGPLSGSGTVKLGTNELIVTTASSGSTTFSGIIQGSGGSFGTISPASGTGTLILSGSGNSTYTGSTSVGVDSVLQAGSANAFASSSPFIVEGTLALVTYNNTIGSLSGTGTVSSTGGVLTVADGGDFSGEITGGGLTLSAGTLILSGTNTYTGTTQINGGTLVLSGSGVLANTTPVNVDGAFDISNMTAASQTIGNLNGSGSVVLGGNKLIVTTSGNGTLSGDISGSGGSLETLGTGRILLSGNNSYTGSTTVGGGSSLYAGSTTAFAPGSAFIVGTGTLTGTLNLAGFNNTILSLNSTDALGTVTSTGGVLTISNGGTFPGVLTGSLGLNLSGGILDLTGTSNNYSGSTTLSNSAILDAGAASALSSSSAVILNDSSQLVLPSTFSNTIASLSGGVDASVSIGLSAQLTVSDGGTFDGAIQGLGALYLSGGTLILSNENDNFTGGTTVGSGTLTLTGSGQLYSSGPVVVDGAFNISGITASSTTIGVLSGTGGVNLGAKELIVTTSGTGALSGNIQGVGGSLVTTGTGTLVLSGANTYTGSTTISSGSWIEATTTSACAPLSDFIVNGGLEIDVSNTIKSLSGASSGFVQASAPATLTISNGGNFSGIMQDDLALSLLGGTLTLNGTDNTYSGATSISNGATLNANASGALSIVSDMTVSGSLLLNGYNNGVRSLSGPGTVNTGDIASDGILTIPDGGTFSGGITGVGGLNLTGGTLTLTTASSANTYSGDTTLTGATLTAGNSGSFAPLSNYTLSSSSILNLAGNNNTIFSLTGDSTSQVILGQSILTINGGSITAFAGPITNTICGGLTISGGTTLTLSNTGNVYCGPTLIEDGTLIISANGALAPQSDVTISSEGTLEFINPATANAANSITNSGILSTQEPITLATTYTQNTRGTLEITFKDSGTTGQILAGTGISLGTGTVTLVVTNASTGAPGLPTTGVYPLLTTSSGELTGEFSPFTPENFTATANLAYYLQGVSMYFSACTDVWSGDADNGYWNDGSNWVGGCVPGVNGNSNDTATFNLSSSSSQVTLVNDLGTVAQPIELFQLNFGTSSTNYTILQFSSASTITFDANPSGTPQINVTAGSHTIDAPIILSQSTELVLTDGAQLTFGSDTTLVSTSTQDFLIRQSNSSTIGSGLLLNEGTLTPYSLTLVSASLQNNNLITPVNALTIAPTIGKIATVINNGANARIGPSAANGSLQIGGVGTAIVINEGTGAFFGATGTGGNTVIGSSGTTTVTNSGASAIFGSSGTNGDMTVGGAGATTITNSGAAAFFGPSGTNGDLTIGSTGTTTIVNNGAASIFGPSGANGDLTIGSSGTTTVTNSGTAVFFGPSGANGNMTIGSTGTTTIVNNGTSATFGPSGTGGDLIVQGSGTTVITNSGRGVRFGATGIGGNVTISSGSLSNTSGALLQAGSGGVLTINGGAVTNDLTSKVGSTEENIVFTSGSLNTSGNVLAYDYSQGGTSTLQLNLTSLPTVFGNVAASSTASVGSTLIINALPGSVTAGQTVDLITALQGVSGTYSTVDYLNFPVGVIPQVVYTPNAVELVTSQTVPTNSTGSMSQFSFTSVNEENILIQREMHLLHSKIRARKQGGSEIASNVSLENRLVAMADPEDGFKDLLAAQTTDRQQHLLSERIEEEEPNPARFYFGPIDSIGNFKTKSNSQSGFDFNSVGIFTGADYAFDDFGAGLAAEYTTTKATLDQHSGRLSVNQVQGSGYATWLPPSLKNLAVDAIVGYGYDWFNIHRNAGTSLTATEAKGNTQGMMVDGLLGTEYIFSNSQFKAIPKNLLFTPLLNLQYIWSRVGDYKEEEAGAYNLHVHTQQAQSLRSTLGTRLEYLVKRNNFTFKPEFDLGWQYEYLDHKRNVHFSTLDAPQFQSISNTVFGAGRNTLLVGVDFLFTACKVFELEISYDLQWNELYTNNTFYLGIGGNF